MCFAIRGKCKGVWKWGRFLLVAPTLSPFTLVRAPPLCRVLLSSSFGNSIGITPPDP